MSYLALLEPQTVQDWLAVGVAAATAAVLIIRKFLSLFRARKPRTRKPPDAD